MKEEKDEKNEKKDNDESLSLIFLHGVGGTGEGWVDLLQRISKQTNHRKKQQKKQQKKICYRYNCCVF